jgi:hypothetical protein
MANLAGDNEKDAPTTGTTSPETGMMQLAVTFASDEDRDDTAGHGVAGIGEAENLGFRVWWGRLW